jgi:hypothetical protein
LEVPYTDDRELVGDILRHGAEVEVLAPRVLRERVSDALQAAARQYVRGTRSGWVLSIPKSAIILSSSCHEPLPWLWFKKWQQVSGWIFGDADDLNDNLQGGLHLQMLLKRWPVPPIPRFVRQWWQELCDERIIKTFR